MLKWLIDVASGISRHDWMLYFLALYYAAVSISAFCSKQPGQGVYWFGAIIILIGILMQEG